MKLILISPLDDYENEIGVLHQLFALGLEFFHLRKPNYSEARLRAFILQINANYRNRIVLHSHHHLAKDMMLKGVHFNSKVGMNQQMEVEEGLQKSASCHSFEQIKSVSMRHMKYVFLSPVFDSISKDGYLSPFSINDIATFFQTPQSPKTIALGGIDKLNISKCKDMGFDGVALMGAVWNSKQAIKNFLDCQRQLINAVKI